MLDQAVEQITAGIASLRQLINDLRPPILDEAGVQPALEHLVHRLGGRERARGRHEHRPRIRERPPGRTG